MANREKSGIYSITNLVSGKRYIGKSKNIHKRWSRHRKTLNSKKDAVNNYLQNAWNKYGGVAFKFEVIEECEHLLLSDREYYWISFYNTTQTNLGYNIVGDLATLEKYKRNGTNLSKRVYNKVYKIDKQNNVVFIYNSVLDICKEIGIDYKKVEKLLFRPKSKAKEKRYTYKGYFLVSEVDYDSSFYYPELLIRKKKEKIKQPLKLVEEYNIKRVPISLENISTGEIRHFSSKKEAAKSLGISKMSLFVLIRGWKAKGGGKRVIITQWRGWKIYKGV